VNQGGILMPVPPSPAACAGGGFGGTLATIGILAALGVGGYLLLK
jgi:hypothetical protein